jgi:hypothetical protein
LSVQSALYVSDDEWEDEPSSYNDRSLNLTAPFLATMDRVEERTQGHLVALHRFQVDPSNINLCAVLFEE